MQSDERRPSLTKPPPKLIQRAPTDDFGVLPGTREVGSSKKTKETRRASLVTGGSCADRDAVLTEFRRFDADGNGNISRSELSSVLRSIDKKRWDKATVDKLIDIIDTNGDGRISYEEFLHWIFVDSKRDDCPEVKDVFSDEVHDAVRAKNEAIFRTAYSAAQAGEWGRVTQLLDAAGCHPSAVVAMASKKSGDTLLHEAAHHGTIASVQFLLRHGADPNAQNKHGQTSVDMARLRSDAELDDTDEVIEILRRAGATVVEPTPETPPQDPRSPTGRRKRATTLGKKDFASEDNSRPQIKS